MVFIVIGFSCRYYSYLIGPMIKQRRRHIVLSDQTPYWLASTGDCIVSKRGEDFVATAYINIPMYVSATEMTDEERERFSNQISRLVSVNKEPVRFSSVLRVMDKDDYLKKIKELDRQRGERGEHGGAEERPGAHREGEGQALHVEEDPGPHRLEVVDGARHLRGGLGDGSKEYEAITIAQQKAKELMNGIGTILGVTPNIIVGSEILKLVEPEYLIPLSTISEEITKKIEHGEVE